jgi:hypothetical protein
MVGMHVRHFCAFLAVLCLSIRPALAQQAPIGDYGSDYHRNLAHVLLPISFLVSLVIAGLFVWRSKRSKWQKVACALGIVFGSPVLCLLGYSVFIR